jgi:hypothetical protein
MDAALKSVPTKLLWHTRCCRVVASTASVYFATARGGQEPSFLLRAKSAISSVRGACGRHSLRQAPCWRTRDKMRTGSAKVWKNVGSRPAYPQNQMEKPRYPKTKWGTAITTRSRVCLANSRNGVAYTHVMTVALTPSCPQSVSSGYDQWVLSRMLVAGYKQINTSDLAHDERTFLLRHPETARIAADLV